MTAIGTLPVVLGTGIHASRPSASAVGKGGLYSCTTHGLVYQTDGSSWTTWATLGVSSIADADVTFTDITTNNSSTSKHGYLKKLDNTAAHYMDGTGAWSTPSGSGGVGNLWTMNKSSSQTLTDNADTLITWDTALIDGGSSVIDLANEQFVAPATGFYMAFGTWLWETVIPQAGSAMACYVNGSDNKAARCRISGPAGTSAQGMNGQWPLSLTASDTVKLYINPGSIGGTAATARGNASAQIASAFTLVRIT